MNCVVLSNGRDKALPPSEQRNDSRVTRGSGAEGGGGGWRGGEAEVRAVEKGGEFGETEGQAFWRGGAEGDVAQFAAGAGGLAVEVEVSVGDGEDFGRIGEGADEIKQGAVAGRSRGAERQAEDGAEMVLELAGDGAFDRPVAGIVDTRSHFIGEKLALVFEEFDGEDPDVLQRFENSVSGFFRIALDGRLEARGGCERQPEDAVAMVVFDERVNGGLARARADRKNGEVAREGDGQLGDT